MIGGNKMDNPEYILNEINKGIKMGMDSINHVTDKVQDKEFKDLLLHEYDRYNSILNRSDRAGGACGPCGAGGGSACVRSRCAAACGC